MATLSRWERLQLAALRLREIQNEADAIYRRFPDLDRRPKIGRALIRARSFGETNTGASWPVKLH